MKCKDKMYGEKCSIAELPNIGLNTWYLVTDHSLWFGQRAGHVSGYVSSVNKLFVHGGRFLLLLLLFLLLFYYYVFFHHYRILLSTLLFVVSFFSVFFYSFFFFLIINSIIKTDFTVLQINGAKCFSKELPG